ncbi:MAG: FKBP-type peptidyl-prolyl cis-trans isomerase [Bacteroidales bacterium]|nr:FKBP-type peptidyl-prolyl cis-trans isomerase [Bacteroidales bacterium]MBQ6822189.1 FKBP-type peptidyl-prolyl cis-trans isomerase [Bacteroidales bacterium]MBR0029501.1 FKBP-type peptidyl-prolyl cis-trans isomerase [Bacteroidales bacterium]MBR0084834.1 FKBP-type peptidyl-prolyl cis-trans isomerase [Bacteroidales bacterium]MBR0291776.1 FKBP-type peptidyl-prolyl cis-trans isomerase [Bacteroidales bacterium]
MKTSKFLFALALGATIVACTPGEVEPAVDGQAVKEGVDEAVKTLKDYSPSKAEIDTVSYLLGVNFGSFLKGYNFGDVNYSKIIAGMKDFVAAKGDFRDPDFNKQFKISPDRINDAFNAYLEKRHNYILLENKDKGDKFLAANRKKAGVQETESGLQYKIIEPGNDNKPADVDTVWVKYKGTLIDGTVFDETAEDAEPISFPLKSVVAGWTEGMQLIGEGGHVELYVPANLAYGEQGRPGIDPNSTLIFDVQLVKVGKFVPKPEEEKKK